MKVAIIEDNQEVLDYYLKYINRYQKEEKVKIELFTYENGADLLKDYNKDFHVIFLDIGLPIMNGLEVANKIREVDESVLIVFVTNLPQYAIEGYKVNALDFLLKPVTYSDFQIEMKKIERNLKLKKKNYLVLNLKGIVHKIPFSSIIYVEIIHHDIVVHTDSNDYKFRGSLKSIEENLDMQLFSRCNNCYLVNLNYVESIDKNIVILTNNKELLISRNRRKPFLDDFTVFLNMDVE